MHIAPRPPTQRAQPSRLACGAWDLFRQRKFARRGRGGAKAGVVHPPELHRRWAFDYAPSACVVRLLPCSARVAGSLSRAHAMERTGASHLPEFSEGAKLLRLAANPVYNWKSRMEPLGSELSHGPSSDPNDHPP